MEQYIIKGGNPLVGEVVIGGAKNAALGILAAAIMTDGECLIDNMPNVRDTNVLLQAMEGIGATIDRKGDNEVVISGKNIDSTGDLIVDNELELYLVSIEKHRLFFREDVISEVVQSTSTLRDSVHLVRKLRLNMA